MRWTVAGCLFTIMAMAVPAPAQLDRFGEARSSDRPIADPPLRSPDAAGLSSDWMKSLQSQGSMSSDEILKRLDKDLGSTSAKPPEYFSQPRYRPSESLDKEPPARSTFK
jgi:hypothetical protein